MRITAYFSAVAITFMLLTSAASAGDADEQKAAKAQRMLRQMALERDAMQTENARLKGEIEMLNGKLGGLKKSSEVAMSRSRDNYAALNENLQQSTQNLRKLESEKDLLQETVDGQGQLIVACEDKNARLVQISRELLVHYEKKGLLDAVLQREPLTQLKRVEIENITQEYQDKIDQQEFKKKTAEARTR
jgi:hypothetical protein